MASRGEADITPHLESSSYLEQDVDSGYEDHKGEIRSTCWGEGWKYL